MTVLALGSPEPVPLAIGGTGWQIWAAIDGNSSAEIVRIVADRFAMTEATVAADVLDFLAVLEHSSLIERRKAVRTEGSPTATTIDSDVNHAGTTK